MQISLIATGKTNAKWIVEGIENYSKRMSYYGKFKYIETPNLKNKFVKAKKQIVMKEEAVLQAKFLEGVDHLILLDERGKAFDSVGF